MKSKNIRIKVKFYDDKTSREKVSINKFIKVKKNIKVKVKK